MVGIFLFARCQFLCKGILMDIIRKTIAKRIKEKGLTYKEVSERIDRNPTYIQQFLERNVPANLKEGDREKLALLLDLTDEQLGGKRSGAVSLSKSIPEIDLVAGLGGGGLATLENTTRNGITFARESIRDYWNLPDRVLGRLGLQPASTACFPVQGDSMHPTLCDGDVVFIDTRHRVPSPPGVYALADEFGGVVVKRLEVVSRPGEEPINVRVTSDNPRHSDRELTLDEIHIIGRYVGRFTT